MRKVFLALLAAALPASSAWADALAERQLAKTVCSQLEQSGQLHNYEISVKCREGVARLDGKVSSPEQRTTAIRLAQKVKGVSLVDCKLTIRNDLKSSGDQQFKQVSATESPSPDWSQNEPPRPMQAFQPQREPASMPSQQQQQMMMANQQQMLMANQQQMMMANQQQMMPNNARMNSMGTNGMRPRGNMPLPSRQMPSMMPVRQASATSGVNQASCQGCNGGGAMGGPMGGGMGGPGMGGGAPMGHVPQGGGAGPNTDNPSMPGYAWPSYASYPNYAALSYPQQYSPTAWPYIGPFYPYPQVPLAWRKVSLEWDDGWWFLDFSSHNSSH